MKNINIILKDNKKKIITRFFFNSIQFKKFTKYDIYIIVDYTINKTRIVYKKIK